MLATVTGLGLSTAAGLNAYIPILVVGLLARFTEQITLPAQYAWMSSGWALTIVAVLLAVELVVDKVAVVDHINDTIQTVIRPAAGGAVFAASSAAAEIDQSAWMRENAWVGWVVGILAALVVHAIKAAVRPVVNTATVGVGTPVVSAAEDTASAGMSLVAILLPALVLLFLAVLAWVAYRLLRRRRRRRGERLATRDAATRDAATRAAGDASPR
jgi:Na+/melibiose symporter-like transporter